MMSHSESHGDLRGQHVLIVEDEMLLALDLSDELERAGGAVDTAASTKQALRLLAARPYDAAVLDFQLLDGDSLPVAEALAARSIPFFFVTAQGTLAALRERHPTTPIFDKPMMPNRMREHLQRVLHAARPAGTA